MKILFVIHYCSPDVNDNSYGPIYLASAGHDVLVISSQHARSLKGDVYASEYEEYQGCKFYRPYKEWTDITRDPFVKWKEVKQAIDDFKPDILIGFGEFNYKLSLAISKRHKIPYFLFVEYLRLEKIASPIRGRTLLKKYFPAIHNYISGLFLRYLANKVTAIMFSYYGDQNQVPYIKELGVDAYYVPWCTDVGKPKGSVSREEGLGLYIGALEKFKNSDELVAALPAILENTSTKKFIVVGPGPYSQDIKRLQNKYGDKLEYIESMPREDALGLIRRATYGFTPVSDCGLGFIGDCWGCGTPLVTTYDLDGFINNGVDAIVSDKASDIPGVIDNILMVPELWKKLSEGGMKRYLDNYTGEAVGKKYLDVVSRYIYK